MRWPFWLLVAVLVFFCIPYLHMGESEPRLMGFPLWFHMSAGAAAALAAASIWWIWKRWHN